MALSTSKCNHLTHCALKGFKATFSVTAETDHSFCRAVD